MKQATVRLSLYGLLCSLLMACGGGAGTQATSSTSATPQGTARTLAITPIAQQTAEWCWAASAQMIFAYYGLPNLNPGNDYQCGIVAAAVGPSSPCFYNCYLCASMSGGTVSNMQLVINGYGVIANEYSVPSRVLSSTLAFSALPISTVVAELDAGRPILAGISPNGYSYPNISQHAVLIVGYDTTTTTPRLIVNDPFPYGAYTGVPSPYIAAGGVSARPGQYSISYAAFVSPMNWGNSLYHIN